ncbi:MAG: choice-of-anchor D domain-containing protein [Xanthomonadales bacterium]|jgi:hypothetical protein|nr:choice-of-anchor D domain-containing protein [Xanthomonadales bacterium]
MPLQRLLLVLLLAVPFSSAWSLDTVVFTNLNQPDSLPAFGQPLNVPIESALAVPFTTDATNTELTKVKLFISSASSADRIQVSIWDVNVSGPEATPGSRVAGLEGPEVPVPTGSEYVSSNVLPLVPIALQPNTSYFVVIENLAGGGSAVGTLTRFGTGSDLQPPLYTLGIPGVSPTTFCRRPVLSWTCPATLISTSLFPVMEIVAEPQAPVLSYSLTANPKSYDFGSVPLNTESTPQAFTVENDGTAAQTLGQLSTTQGFVIKSDACSNQLLAPGASCSVSVAFAPTIGGQTVGAVRIPSDPLDPVTQYAIVLGGQSPAVFSVGGNLSGLAANGSIVISNNTTRQTLLADGAFSFPSQNDGASYQVAVDVQPTGQVCSVTNGSGVISGADVTGVQIDCVDNQYAVGGVLSGLVPGDALVLENNGQDDLTLTADGVFRFAQGVPYQDAYAVTVKSQPSSPSESCTVTNGAGVMGAGDVSNISVTCALNTFSVGGSLTGLAAGESIVLLMNGAQQTTLNADGSFQFLPLADATSYAVTIGQQPTGQTCTVSNGSGILAGSDVNDVTVACIANRYRIGGNLSGLASQKSVVLVNNGGDDLTLSADGAFTFATPVASGSPYSVTVKTDPVGETCAVANGSGTVQAADINQISVTCVADTYRVAGNLTGLVAGESLELLLNGSLNIVLTGNGYFQFPAIADGSTYLVTIGTQPQGQTCSVANGSGTLSGATVTNVAVDCVKNEYTIGGQISGLVPGDTVVLQNNGGDNLSLDANGSFVFATPVPYQEDYRVTVLTQPVAPSETCTVRNGSGTMPAGDVNTVSVVCAIDEYTVGGAVTGLESGESLVLQINGANDQTLAADGNFVFPALADGTAYTVTVAAQPTGQTCAVTNGGGTLAGADVTNVSINCTDNTTPPVQPPTNPAEPRAIPANSTWALILLIMSLLGVGWAALRRRT